MNTFYHSGKLGDIIYSLPTIKALGGGNLFLNIPIVQYVALAPLLLAQSYIEDVFQVEGALAPGPLPEGFIDLSKFRQDPDLGKIHLTEAHLRSQGMLCISKSDCRPWLTVPDECFFGDMKIVKRITAEPYAIVSVTPRYRDRYFSWGAELNKLRSLIGWDHLRNIYFMGLREEYDNSLFAKEGVRTAGTMPVRFLHTPTFSQAAYCVQHAAYFSANQNAMMAIRQGLGLPYRLEQSPHNADCNTGSSRETILNPLTRKLHLFTSTVKQLFT